MVTQDPRGRRKPSPTPWRARLKRALMDAYNAGALPAWAVSLLFVFLKLRAY